MAECIHGFEDELCDQCFPKTVAAAPRVARPAKPRSTPGARVPKISATDRRLHHVTRIEDLPEILEDGQLLEQTAWTTEPPVSGFDRVVLVTTALEVTNHGGRLSAGGAEIPDPFPFASVTLVAVANEPTRDRVKAMVDDADYAIRVAVYPPWFSRDAVTSS